MLHALITQREGHNMYGKYTDVLEAAYVEFYESLGIRLRPVSNFTKNFDEIVDEQFDLLIVTGGRNAPSETLCGAAQCRAAAAP